MQLYEKLMQLVQPAYKLMYEHIQSEALDNFKETFNNALKEGHGFAEAARDCTKKSMSRCEELCEDATTNHATWDSTNIWDIIKHDLDSYITEVRAVKLYELTTLYESNIEEALSSHVEALLKLGRDDTWLAIRRHFNGDTETVVSNLSFALSGFEMEEKEKEDIISKLKNYATRIIEGKAKYEAGIVLSRMKERFTFKFLHDNDSMPRVSWSADEDIPTIAKTARTSCLKLLSVLAAIRLEKDETDTIFDALALLLIEQWTDTITSQVSLISTTWEKVPAPNTLLTPIQCKSLWNQFLSETEYMITQATASQEAPKHTRSNHNDVEKPGFFSFFRNMGQGMLSGVNDMVGNNSNV